MVGTREGRRTVTAATRVDIIIPSPSNLIALLNDDEVSTLATFDHVDSGT